MEMDFRAYTRGTLANPRKALVHKAWRWFEHPSSTVANPRKPSQPLGAPFPIPHEEGSGEA